MKKNVITILAVSMMLVAINANANMIGIFADLEGTVCVADLNESPYQYLTIYYLALLSDVARINACEFGTTDDILTTADAAGVEPSYAWNTELIIGSLPDGIALAFAEPLEGPICYLGEVEYLLFFTVMDPVEQRIQVVPSAVDVLVVVDADEPDPLLAEIPADGWGFVFNCQPGGDYGQCLCTDAVPTEDTSWGSLKSMY